MLNVKNIDDIEFESVDWSDYPDFCDAQVISATWSDGRDLTEAEIDELITNHGEYVYRRLVEKLF